jgi:transcriptional regulator with XRE-family HTH domain
MPSFQIAISPSKRAAGRFVLHVRRMIQKALAEEEKKRGITQSDIARAIGVNRSVISREIRGHKDLTLGRVAELAWALGRKASFDLPEIQTARGANHVLVKPPLPQQQQAIPGPLPEVDTGPTPSRPPLPFEQLKQGRAA